MEQTREHYTVFGIELVSPRTGSPLAREGEYLVGGSGEKFPVVHNVPRFVTDDNYARSFGLQWKKFDKVQLDSYTKTTISERRLLRLFGGSFDDVKGKTVLEAGCGAGRFTEILLQHGARVFAADISGAVEANYNNCRKYPGYFVCQADIVSLPVKPGSFDVVMCVGVIQHTPDPEKTIESLCSYVKPGGLLVIDHYTHGYPQTPVRRILRPVFLKLPPQSSMRGIRNLTVLLWPVHRYLGERRNNRWISRARTIFLHLSPLVDYHDAYPELNEDLLLSWSMLDTHDTLTDRYKHLRSADDIRRLLEKCGMADIRITLQGNGVEARAKKPVQRDVQKDEVARCAESAV